jgi:hypothetical protein
MGKMQRLGMNCIVDAYQIEPDVTPVLNQEA